MFGFFKKNKTIMITAPMKGEAVHLSEVPDEVFSQKMIGDGIAIKPSHGMVVSPCNGTVAQILSSNHAVGIVMEEGLEVLIHVGIDTVELKGQGFRRIANVGDQVKIGDPLIEVDLDFLVSQGKPTITPVIITNMEMVEKLDVTIGNVTGGKSQIVEVEMKR
ncbi:MAG: PTS sugar transporter subunit IIA [Bacillota bacterium]